MEREPKTIAVTGVSGVGKDFLIGETIKDLSEAKVYSTNRELSRMLSEQGITITDLESPEQIDAAVEQSNQRIVDSIHSNPDSYHIVNTHIVHSRPESVVTDQETLAQISPRDIVVVTADPEVIAERRQNDRTRNRIVEPVPTIAAKQESEIRAAEHIARTIGAKVTTVVNDEEQTSENITKINKLLEHPLDIGLTRDAKPLTRQQLIPLLLEHPDARIPLSNFEFGELGQFELDLLKGIDTSGSEVEAAGQLYNRLLAKMGFSEDAYISFNNDDDRERVFREHLTGNITSNEAHQLYTCTEAAIEIAKLLNAALGKVGYMESYAERGVKTIPHTAYVIQLNSSDGRAPEFVFDPFASFSHSDSLLRQTGHTIDITSNLRTNKQLVDDKINELIAECESYNDVLDIIRQQVLAHGYYPIEETSLIKSILSRYQQVTGHQTAYDRFSINEVRHIACVAQFLDENSTHSFLISHGWIGEFSNAEIAKMETSGVLSHISLARRTDFSAQL
ncbi:AAA family ATPase [Candidatus Saccharibacteria bacterium]|nr:AAA family ATPase [Candidatus Saccharibacteria bacterium]